MFSISAKTTIAAKITALTNSVNTILSISFFMSLSFKLVLFIDYCKSIVPNINLIPTEASCL